MISYSSQDNFKIPLIKGDTTWKRFETLHVDKSILNSAPK